MVRRALPHIIVLALASACVETEIEPPQWRGTWTPAPQHVAVNFTASGNADSGRGAQGLSLEFDAQTSSVVYLRDVKPGRIYTVPAQAFEHVAFHVTLGAAELRVVDAVGDSILDWTATDALMHGISDPVANEGFVPLNRPGAAIEFRSSEPIAFARFELGAGHEAVEHDPVAVIPDHALELFVAHPGRWIPTDDVLAIANQQYLTYTGAPRACTGNFLAGTREVADFLKASFEGARSYGGYSCRANTANPSELSVHASGRAIDLFVPLYSGDADNDLGDPIAHYLITNAVNLGIEFVVWDRTSWGAHRDAPKHRAYTGPHPHHDHLHIELSPSSANRTGRTFPPIVRDEKPVGYLDSANCDTISGWAQDPDAADRPIPVHVYIGGPAGTPGAVGYAIEAKQRREDLCAALGSCDHGFSMPTPRGFLDGTPHEVYVYGIDVSGGENALLASAPQTLTCAPANVPFAQGYPVKRHVTNPEVMAAWAFDFHDVVTLDDATLDAIDDAPPVAAAPELMRVEGSPEVYLVDVGVKRHVPSPAVMDHWRFDWSAVQNVASLDDRYTGIAVTDRPFLARGTGGAVYLIEPPAPLWATDLTWQAPAQLGRGQNAQLTLSLTNRGSATWSAGAMTLTPQGEFACAGCGNALITSLSPGETGQVSVVISAGDQMGARTFCFDLGHAGFSFSAPGMGGPTVPSCVDIDVVADPVALDDINEPDPELGTPRFATHASATTDRGCNTAGAWPTFMGWLVLGLLRRR